MPDSIDIQYSLNSQIKATYYKTRKIVFTSPEELKDRVVKNIFEASFVVRNAPSFPYSDWVTIGAPEIVKSWSIFRYESEVSKYFKQLKQDQIVGQVIINQIDDDKIHEDLDAIDPRELNDSQWNSDVVDKWICSMQKPFLVLKMITHFRRYGPGLSFEFLCTWGTGSPTKTIQTWQKYSTLQKQPFFADYLRMHWDLKVERERNWEDEVDRFQKDEGFDVSLPEIGNAYAIEKITIRAKRVMEREERKRKKRKQLNESDRLSEDGEKSSDHSDSETTSSEDSESSEDHSPKPVLRNVAQSLQEKVEWIDIFDKSSVVPVPRYQVKRFIEKSRS